MKSICCHQITAGKILCIIFTINSFILISPIYAFPDNRPITALYFGMHIQKVYQNIKWWPNIPFGSWRLWGADVAWPDLEPQKGKWNFNRLDKYVSLSEKNEIRLLYTFGVTPQWASSRPNEKSGYGLGNAAAPKNMNDWQDYVRTVVTRYKGRIKEYEIWNEPNLTEFYTGDIQTMLLMAKEAYKIIKEIDPHAIVVSPSATAKYGIPWLDKYFAHGGSNFCDVVGYHFYIPAEAPEQLPSFIQSIKDTMSKYSVKKPLWNTESGWWISDDIQKPVWINPKSLKLQSSESVSFISRALILSAANGIERFYWYAWDNGDTGIVNKQTGKAHEGANAFIALNDWLIGRTIDSCERKLDGIWTCAISEKSAKKIGEIIWSDSNSKTIPRSQKLGYTVLEQLDGSEKLLNSNNIILITSSPIFLKIQGKVKHSRLLKKTIISRYRRPRL